MRSARVPCATHSITLFVNAKIASKEICVHTLVSKCVHARLFRSSVCVHSRAGNLESMHSQLCLVVCAHAFVNSACMDEPPASTIVLSTFWWKEYSGAIFRAELFRHSPFRRLKFATACALKDSDPAAPRSESHLAALKWRALIDRCTSEKLPRVSLSL